MGPLTKVEQLQPARSLQRDDMGFGCVRSQLGTMQNIDGVLKQHLSSHAQGPYGVGDSRGR